MGGHSHWAGIKHKKALVDAKKGKVFTKILREITIAAKMSGGNPDQNPRLRKAVDDARAANMPSDNVKRAIMKGTGQLPGVSYEEIHIIVLYGYCISPVRCFAAAQLPHRLQVRALSRRFRVSSRSYLLSFLEHKLPGPQAARQLLLRNWTYTVYFCVSWVMRSLSWK